MLLFLNTTAATIHNLLSTVQRVVMADWVDAIENIISVSPPTCSWLVQLLSTDGLKYLKPYLLEATARDVRSNFSALLERAFANLVKHRAGDSDVAEVNVILSALVEMMASNFADNVKHCGQYFIISSESRRDLAVHRRDLRHSKLGGGGRGRNRSSGRRRPDGGHIETKILIRDLSYLPSYLSNYYKRVVSFSVLAFFVEVNKMI